MKLCELCIHQQATGICAMSRPTPLKMRCTDFQPGMERFFSAPGDYTGLKQLKQMAVFFGLSGKELQRVLALGGTLNKARS